MKKIFGVFILLLTCYITFTIDTKAALVQKGTSEWQEKSGWWLWEKTTYYKSYNYLEDSYYYRLYFKNLSGTTYWDPNGPSSSASISITSTQSVAETKSWSISGEIGLKVPVKAVEIAGKIGGSYSNSKTYTVSNSAIHARALDKNSPKGFYSLQAAMDADEYYLSVYSKDKASSSYSYQGSGNLLKYRANDTYVYLRYTTTQH